MTGWEFYFIGGMLLSVFVSIAGWALIKDIDESPAGIQLRHRIVGGAIILASLFTSYVLFKAGLMIFAEFL